MFHGCDGGCGRSTITSTRTIRCGSSKPLSMRWTLRRRGSSASRRRRRAAPAMRQPRAAFQSVFRAFVLLCRQLDLYGRELLAVDGARIKAVKNRDHNFTRTSLQEFIRAAGERLDDYLRRLALVGPRQELAGAAEYRQARNAMTTPSGRAVAMSCQSRCPR